SCAGGISWPHSRFSGSRCLSFTATELLCQLDQSITARDDVVCDDVLAHAVKSGAARTEYNRRNTGLAKDSSIRPETHAAAHRLRAGFCESGFDHARQNV